MIHKLKINANSLDRINLGDKSHTIRKNDRDFQTGDKIVFDPIPGDREPYRNEPWITPFDQIFTIKHVERYIEQETGYVVLSLSKPKFYVEEK